MNTDDHRKAFEEWAERTQGAFRPHRFKPDEKYGGQYRNHHDQMMWEAWLEASRRMQRVIKADHELISTLRHKIDRAELETELVRQGYEDILEIIAKGGTTADVLKFLDTKEA